MSAAGATGSRPLISVIVPVHNGERYLREAIDSALGQSYEHFEVIVIDDGSMDGSAEIARGCSGPVRLVRQARGGTAAARNRGIELAKGGLLAFLDQDDRWAGSKLSAQFAALEGRPELDGVFGHVQQFLSADLPPAARARIHCASEPLPGILPTTLLIRRESFFRVGPFDPAWQLGEWSNWYVRAVEAGLKFDVLDAVVGHRRLHAGNKGIERRDLLKEYPRLLKASLDRRRKNAR